jgi:hypothetical protein
MASILTEIYRNVQAFIAGILLFGGLVAISNAFPRYGGPDFLFLAGGIVGVVIGILIIIPLIKVGFAERDEKAEARIRNVFLEAGLSEE